MLPWIYPVDDARLVHNGGYAIPSRPSHKGLDFHAPEGTSIKAVDDGFVVNEGFWTPDKKMDDTTQKSGNYLVLMHPDNLMSSYSHLSSKLVKKGDTVKRGQIIGKSGHTGYVIPAGIAGAHLHFAKLIYNTKLRQKQWEFADPTGSFIKSSPLIVESVSTYPKTASFSQTAEAGTMDDKRFDPIFEKYLDETPLALARAMAYPYIPTMDKFGSIGLFQITDTVRESFNKAVGTAFSKGDLTDPDKNSRVGLWLLSGIAFSYAAKHPSTLKMDWKDLRYIGLLLLGYHAGQAAVKSLVKRLEDQRVPKEGITAETVHQAAKVSSNPADKLVAEPARLAYVQSIVKRYAAQSDFPGGRPVLYMDPIEITASPPAEETSPFQEAAPKSEGIGIGGKLLLAAGGFVTFIAAFGKKKKR